MKTKFIALTFLAILLVSSVLAVTIDLNSTTSRTENLLSASNGTDSFYYLNFTTGTTDNELISTYEFGNEDKNMSVSGVQLAQGDLRENSVKVYTHDYYLTGNPHIDGGIGGAAIVDYTTNRNNPRTYSLMVKPNSLIINSRMWDSGTGYIAWTANGWKFDAPASNGPVFSGTTLSTDDWTHIAVVVNATEYVWLYENGVLINESQSASLTGGATVNAAIVGRGSLVNSGIFNGSVRDMVVYEEELNADQIKSIYYNDGLPSISNNLTQLNVGGQFQVYPNGTLIRYSNSAMWTSLDGTNFDLAFNFTTGGFPEISGTSTMWLDERNRTWLNPWSGQKIYRSGENSLTSWTEVIEIGCDNPTGGDARLISPQGITNGPNGDVYLGSYVLGGSNDEMCGHIYKVTNAGVGSLIYNATADTPNTRNVPRHVHYVQCNPYSDYCYVSIGDTTNRKRMLRFDKATGTNFITIREGLIDEISWQPTAMAFNEEYMFLGEDLGTTDINNYGSAGASKLFRVEQGDHNLTNFDFIWNYDQNISGFISFINIDSQNRMYWGLQTVNNTSEYVIMRSDDNGNSSKKILSLAPGSYNNGGGIGGYSNFDNNDIFYVAPNQLNLNSPLRITPIATPTPKDWWRLNQDGGDIGYNIITGQNATINGTGMMWENNSLYKLLNRGSEYTIDKENGIITLVNSDYQNQPVDITYEYFTWESIYNHLKGYWSFDFGNSTTAPDLSGNGNDGLMLGGTEINTTCNSGFGNCINNPQTGSGRTQIPAGQYLNLTNNNITISMWVRNTQAPLGSIFSSSNTVSGARWYIGQASSTSGTFNIGIFNGTDGMQISSFTGRDVRDGEWTHLYFILRNLDGVTTIEGKANGDHGATHTTTYIGGDFYNGNPGFIGRYGNWLSFNGSIDEVMIFNYGLNYEQALALYRGQSQRFQDSGKLSTNGSVSIESGNSSIALTTNTGTNYSGSSLLLALAYYNGAWATLSQQAVIQGIANTFSIPTSTTAFTYNYTLESDDYGAYSPFVGQSLDWEASASAVIPDIVDCSTFTTTGYSIIMIIASLIILYFVSSFAWKAYQDGEIDLGKLIILFLTIVICIALWLASGQNLGASCGAVG